MIKLELGLAGFLVLATGLLAEVPSMRPPPPEEPRRSQFVFSLLPKSLQKNPALDFHVITEMTEEGRKVAEPTPARPVHYQAQIGNFSQLGNNTPGNEHPPSVETLTKAMEKALASSNYVRAEPPKSRPSLLVVFNYGSFARFSTEAYEYQQMLEVEDLFRSRDATVVDEEPPPLLLPGGTERDVEFLLPLVLAGREERKDVLARAALIGGDKFAREFERVLNEQANHRRASSAAGEVFDMTSPLRRFMDENEQVMELVEESFSSCYFVIASAYDYVAMAKGKKVLLWRTKMTVNSSGISMTESLPSLIVSSGPYLGREMTTSVTLSRRISRQGRVDVGTLRVLDYEEPAPAQPTPKAERTK